MDTALFASGGRTDASTVPTSSESRDNQKNIVIEPLSATQWRARDRRWSEHDARALLGFIERTDDLFEVMQLDHGFEWFSFGSLAEATTHFTNMQPSALRNNENVLSLLRADAQ